MGKEGKLEEVIVVYKVNLHCPQCALDIRNPLLRTPGVRSVDVKFEKNEVAIKGSIDGKKIHERLEKWSKRKVEILSQTKVEATKEEKETKKEAVKTIIMKTYIHCEQCEHDLKQTLIKHKGIHHVTINRNAQTVTIEGTIESAKLISYMRNRVHKHAEIIEPPKGKKEEKEETKEKKKEPIAVDVKSKDEIVEYTELKKVEAKTKEAETPYFIHYVYAPQLFSDENPNACTIM